MRKVQERIWESGTLCHIRIAYPCKIAIKYTNKQSLVKKRCGNGRSNPFPLKKALTDLPDCKYVLRAAIADIGAELLIGPKISFYHPQQIHHNFLKLNSIYSSLYSKIISQRFREVYYLTILHALVRFLLCSPLFSSPILFYIHTLII